MLNKTAEFSSTEYTNNQFTPSETKYENIEEWKNFPWWLMLNVILCPTHFASYSLRLNQPLDNLNTHTISKFQFSVFFEFSKLFEFFNVFQFHLVWGKFCISCSNTNSPKIGQKLTLVALWATSDVHLSSLDIACSHCCLTLIVSTFYMSYDTY